MELTTSQLEAAQLVFKAKLSNKEIAENVGVSELTLQSWWLLQEFRDELLRLRRELFEKVHNNVLITKEGRLAAKLERHRQLTMIVDERAAAADTSVPGARSGFLVKREVAQGDAVREVYTVDLALSRELTRLESAIANEVGPELEAAAEDSARPRRRDLSSLTNNELASLTEINEKIEAANPWLPGSSHPSAGNGLMYKQALEARKHDSNNAKGG